MARGPQSGSVSIRQWAAVITIRGVTSEPPQNDRAKSLPPNASS